MPADSRLVRVFISSTFKDFIWERDLLVKTVFPELRRRCRERLVEFVDIDLRWGIAREENSLQVCLEQIDRCRSTEAVFFIGLLGKCYGSTPDPDLDLGAIDEAEHEWLQQQLVEGKSYTELEILHGVLNNTDNPQIRERAFFYFREDGYETDHWQEIKAAHRHLPEEDQINPGDFTARTPEDDRKQRDLKQRIRDAGLPHTPREYTTPDDLGERVLEDLWAEIEKTFPDETPDETEKKTREHRAFLLSRSMAYVEREGLFDTLDAFVHQHDEWEEPSAGTPLPEEEERGEAEAPAEDEALPGEEEAESPPSRPLVILGESGSGKSALLAAWLVERHEKQAEPGFTFFHFVGATPTSDQTDWILKRLFGALRSHGAIPSDRNVPRETEEMAAELPEWLQRLSDSGGGVILIDALNQLATSHDRELWWWPEDWPENVRVILSTLPGEALKEIRRRGWTGGALDENTLEIPPLNQADKESVMRDYLEHVRRGQALGPLEQIILNAEQTSNPLFLRTVLDELRVRGRRRELGDRLKEMLECEDPAQLFDYILTKLEEDPTLSRPELLRSALGLIGCALRGLNESEILELLSTHEVPKENRVPQAHWAPFYLALEASLISRDGQLGFFHDYLQQAVTERYLKREDKNKARDRLAQPALDWEKQRFSDSLVDYGFRHGIRHLVENHRLDDALALIRNAKRREAAAENAGDPDNLHDELARLRKAWAIKRPEEHETGIELAALALTEPQRLAHHLRQKLDEAGENGAWKRTAHLAEAGRSPAEQVMLALRATCRSSSAPNEDLRVPLDRWLDNTGLPEWGELAEQITAAPAGN